MATVFFSYSHADENLRNELEKHLTMLKRDGTISIWHDRKIVVGTSVDSSISQWLERAEVILLLVSSDFLVSEYCYGTEMSRAIERHRNGEAKVIPVILRPCDWHAAPFGKLLATPTDGKAVTLWTNQDAAFLDITKSIRTALAASRTLATPTAAKSMEPSNTSGSQIDARSSNLRIRKTFTDRDQDDFLDNSFEYIAHYFDNSLQELKARNPDIDTRFKLEPKSFEATIYRGGKAIARCEIATGKKGFGSKGITLSYGTRTISQGINENLSVEVGDQSLSLKAWGFSMRGQGKDSALSQQGAAEYYWSIFIEPLQS
jgi:hypothetical protein